MKLANLLANILPFTIHIMPNRHCLRITQCCKDAMSVFSHSYLPMIEHNSYIFTHIKQILQKPTFFIVVEQAQKSVKHFKLFER